jgi:hypothetical protein
MSNLWTPPSLSGDNVFWGTSLAAAISAPVDNINHYLGVNSGATTTAPTAASPTTPLVKRACTITEVYFTIVVAGTNGTAETGTLFVRVNNTTDFTVVNNTLAWNVGATGATHSVTGLSISLVPGDFWTLKIDPPTWATNPTNVFYVGQTVLTFP